MILTRLRKKEKSQGGMEEGRVQIQERPTQPMSHLGVRNFGWIRIDRPDMQQLQMIRALWVMICSHKDESLLSPSCCDLYVKLEARLWPKMLVLERTQRFLRAMENLKCIKGEWRASNDGLKIYIAQKEKKRSGLFLVFTILVDSNKLRT